MKNQFAAFFNAIAFNIKRLTVINVPPLAAWGTGCAWILKKAENETGFAKERSQIKVKQIESYGIKIKSLKLKKYCIIQRFLKCCYRTPNQTPKMPNQCVKASYKDWAHIVTRFTPSPTTTGWSSLNTGLLPKCSLPIPTLLTLILLGNGGWTKTPMDSFVNIYQNHDPWQRSPRRN